MSAEDLFIYPDSMYLIFLNSALNAKDVYDSCFFIPPPDKGQPNNIDNLSYQDKDRQIVTSFDLSLSYLEECGINPVLYKTETEEPVSNHFDKTAYAGVAILTDNNRKKHAFFLRDRI
ncbi:MAG: hypothetical protein KAS90_04980 [Candidatus Aenigmarchaeota archaeon]|nr:hypothetical protein [Candidatus Aenigmarchaeota archaeon]